MNVAGATRATYAPDIQGSVVASLDASSGAMTKAGYQPYGESGSTSGAFRYTGARIDAETNGLYDFRARMYSPALGRFLQADPAGTAGGFNLYVYVGNDPLNLVDIFGRTPDAPGAGGTWAGIGNALGNVGSGISSWLQTQIPEYDFDTGQQVGARSLGRAIAPYVAFTGAATAVVGGEAVAAAAAAGEGALDSGAASSLQGFRLSQQLAAEQAAGATAPTSITSYSTHVLKQIAGRDAGIGVSESALKDAFANPNAIQYAPSGYGPTFRYVGNNATVVVNPEGNAITGWATNSAGIGR